VKDCDLLISVGTSGIVMPAAGLPGLALESGASVIHVNKADVSMGEQKEFMLLGAAIEILPMLAQRIETIRGVED